MDFDFDNKELIRLYTTGKSRKLRGLPKQVFKNFFARIEDIEAAETTRDFRPGLHFEKLKGTRNSYSLRVTRKWRLELRVEWQNKEKTKGRFIIEGLSKHYGD